MGRRWAGRFATALALPCIACGPDSHEQTRLVDQGLAALSAWEALPNLDQERFRSFTSRQSDGVADASGAAGDLDFNNFVSVCGDVPPLLFQHVEGDSGCAPGLSGYVIAASDGPGFVSRIFFSTGTIVGDGGPPKVDSTLHDERIRIYVDDLTSPAYDGLLRDWLATSGPFPAPAVRADSGALVSYVPVSYERTLRVLLDALEPMSLNYFQVEGRSSPDTLDFSSGAYAATGDRRPVLDSDVTPLTPPGGAVWTDTAERTAPGGSVSILDREGEGTLERLEIAVDPAEAVSELGLRGYWENAGTPAIEVSLAALAAAEVSPADFETLALSVRREGSALRITLALPMPFSSHAHFDVASSGSAAAQLGVRAFGRSTHPAGKWGHLYVRETSRDGRSPDAFTLLNVSGSGKYVGTTFFVKSTADAAFSSATDPLNALEYDPVMVVDGNEAFHGTGTEELFDAGWYFARGTFSAPFAALVSLDRGATTGNGQIAAVRWHLLGDAVPFADSFRFAIEPGPAALGYRAAAFFYLIDRSPG